MRPGGHTLRRWHSARSTCTEPPAYRTRVATADRRALLAGTALASTLLLGSLFAPAPASAQVTCPTATFPPPGPITVGSPVPINDDIVCINVDNRLNDPGNADSPSFAIFLYTSGGSDYIDLDNSGSLNADYASRAGGVYTRTNSGNSSISIVNSGRLEIVNSGDMIATPLDDAFGIYALTFGDNSGISVLNSASISAMAEAEPFGIYARSLGLSSSIDIVTAAI